MHNKRENRMKHNFYLLATIHFLLAASCNGMNKPLQKLLVNTLYGNFKVTEPVLIDLFNNPVMERIKQVRQYGAEDYVIKQKKEYTRYEHCVGVWALLRMYGADLEEQIAGLLHDASHTVFSHVGDRLFKHESALCSYQDDIHEWYLKKQKIDLLLTHHGISLTTILHSNNKHTMLEQDLPNICADRLEYNLQAGLLTDHLRTDDIATILDNIRYGNGHWFFVNEESAKKLAMVSLFNTEHVWSSTAAYFITKWTAQALERALEIKLLTHNDIHFSTDPLVWNKLWISNDPVIIGCLDNIVNYKTAISMNAHKKEPIKVKFRGLDPLVQINDQLKRLTSIDSEYNQEYERVKAYIMRKSKL
jgi:HD superfamily phosphohydrolase